VTPFVTAAAGFLAAVLWFDLMHDVQVVGCRDADLPQDVLTSITGYYRRVTTDAHPMNRLVAAVMLATITTVAVQVAVGDAPTWVAASGLGLALAATALAAARTVGNAVRLGRQTDAADVQSRLARSIFHDHVFCFAAIALLLIVELAFAR
jgi:hypothetical protein